MSGARRESDILTRAFAARGQTRMAPEQCPEAEQMFDAAAGTLGREQRLRLIDHIAQCAQCTEAWRIAIELGVRPAKASSSGASLRRFAVAASVVVAVGIAAYVTIPDRDFLGYRQAIDVRAPVAMTSENLPRDHFVLRWSPGSQGVTYAVRLSTVELRSLFVEEGLTRAEIVVPAEIFDGVSDGTPLLWQIEVREPDGQRRVSQTYTVTLQ